MVSARPRWTVEQAQAWYAQQPWLVQSGARVRFPCDEFGNFLAEARVRGQRTAKVAHQFLDFRRACDLIDMTGQIVDPGHAENARLEPVREQLRHMLAIVGGLHLDYREPLMMRCLLSWFLQDHKTELAAEVARPGLKDAACDQRADGSPKAR